jgi:hypothetical protein
MMNRVEVLDTARDAITRDRAATHGDAENSFQRIADFWTVWLGDRLKGEITPFDVAQMMVLFKSARARGNPSHMDNLVDQAGYSALSAEMVTGDGKADLRKSIAPPPFGEDCIKCPSMRWDADCNCARCQFFAGQRRKG